MTTILKKAIGRLKSLPEHDQELYARQLLKEMDSDERWDELFDLTTDEQWEKMVAEAKQDAAENGTLSIDELKGGL